MNLVAQEHTIVAQLVTFVCEYVSAGGTKECSEIFHTGYCLRAGNGEIGSNRKLFQHHFIINRDLEKLNEIDLESRQSSRA